MKLQRLLWGFYGASWGCVRFARGNGFFEYNRVDFVVWNILVRHTVREEIRLENSLDGAVENHWRAVIRAYVTNFEVDFLSNGACYRKTSFYGSCRVSYKE